MENFLIRLPLAVLIILFIAPTVHSELLVYEPFDYSVGPLAGNSGALGLAWTWSDLWYVDQKNPPASEVAEGSLIHPYYLIDPIGNHATVNNGGSLEGFATPFYDDGTSFWVGFLYQYVPGSVWGGWTLFFYDHASKENAAYLDLWGGYPGLESSYTGQLQRAVVDDPNAVMWIVIKAETSGSPTSTEMIYMWVDPFPDTEPNIANADVALEYNIIEEVVADHIHIAGEGYPIGYRVDELKIGRTFYDISPAPPCELARYPNPADDAINIDSTNVVLSWQPPPCLDDVTYNIFLGTIPGDDPNFTDNPLVAEKLSDTSYNATYDVTSGTRYYWRVDVSPDDANNFEGSVWTFTTKTQLPSIITEPEDLTVPAGTDAQFTIEVLNDSTFTWYFSDTPDGEGNPIPGSDSPILNITNVQQENEGYYYCVAVNDYGQSESLHVRLLTERLMAHWKFDGNLNDEIDPANNGLSPAPITYEASVDGKAVVIADPNQFVMIENDIGRLKSITLSAWFKPTTLEDDQIILTSTEGSDDGVVCLRADDDELWGQVFGSAEVGLGELTQGQWNHCVLKYDTDAEQANLYLNGEPVASAGIDPSVVPILPPLSIGAKSALEGNYVDGLIDDVRLYNYPVSNLDIALLYTNFVTGATACLGNPQFDFNEDCVVNILDLAIIAANWANCNIIPDCLFSIP